MPGFAKGLLFPFIAAGAVSAAVSYILVRWPGLLPVVDIPNERSSHTRPKPRTGGIALLLALITGLACFGGLPGATGSQATLILAGASVFFLLGLADDLFRLPEWFRLLVQTAVALVIALKVVRLDALQLPGMSLALPPALATGITVFWITGFVNAFNFMDGIDGIAAGETVAAGLFFSLLDGSIAPLLLSAAALGFLWFNREPSRIFMGDGGSYLLGFLLAVFAVWGSGRGSAPMAAYVLILGTFVADTTITLIRRMMRGERWYKAHRSHYYQRLVSLGFSHQHVSRWNFGVSVLLGLSALLYIQSPAWLGWGIIALWTVFFGSIARWIEICQRR